MQAGPVDRAPLRSERPRGHWAESLGSCPPPCSTLQFWCQSTLLGPALAVVPNLPHPLPTPRAIPWAVWVVWSTWGPLMAWPVAFWRFQKAQSPVKPHSESSKEQCWGAQQRPGRTATSSSAMMPWKPFRTPSNRSWGCGMLGGASPGCSPPSALGPHLVLSIQVGLMREGGPGPMPAVALGA